MRKVISVILATIIVIFTLHTIHQVQVNDQLLQLQRIQLRSTQMELDRLNEEYELLEADKTKTLQEKEAEILRLQQREAELQQQLQARRLIKERQAVAYAAADRFGGDCASWIRDAGITDVTNAVELIRRESGCNPYAVNRSSGACGVAQELPCGKSGCTLGDGACQVRWMNSYVLARYGSWGNAVTFHDRNNWY